MMKDEMQKIDELAKADGWQDYPGDLDAPSAADWLCDCASVPSDPLANVRAQVLRVLSAYVTGAVDATEAGAELGRLLP
jgi:hypothetical protein